MKRNELRILTPVGMLGYGFPAADYWRGIQCGADAVIVDAGSTDPGPYMLGLDKLIVSESEIERDLEVMLAGTTKKRIPLIIGSAGGAGTNSQVDRTVNILRRIAERHSYQLNVAIIYADIPAAVVRRRFAQGRVAPCASAPQLQECDIDASINIVAQMGAEPIVKALRDNPGLDVLVAGRASDPAPYAAFCQLHGFTDPGVFWHMGKIMECGGVCAEPKGRVILATVRNDSFDIEPMSMKERCTATSVAAHTLYEKTRPDLLAGPGGVLDLSAAKYEELDGRTVRVSGGKFQASPKYAVKLEGAALSGQRSIFIGGIRDPILISQIDDFLANVHAHIKDVYSEVRSGEAQLHFHVFGKNAVAGTREPGSEQTPLELGILGEVTASTQEMANAICGNARISVLHLSYPGQLATAGNLALPLNPPDNAIGPVFRFSLYHLMETDSPTELFPSYSVHIAGRQE